MQFLHIHGVFHTSGHNQDNTLRIPCSIFIRKPVEQSLSLLDPVVAPAFYETAFGVPDLLASPVCLRLSILVSMTIDQHHIADRAAQIACDVVVLPGLACFRYATFAHIAESLDTTLFQAVGLCLDVLYDTKDGVLAVYGYRRSCHLTP